MENDKNWIARIHINATIKKYKSGEKENDLKPKFLVNKVIANLNPHKKCMPGTDLKFQRDVENLFKFRNQRNF